MTLDARPTVSYVLRAAMLGAMLTAAAAAAFAQSGVTPPSLPRPTPENQRDGNIDFNNREGEMRSKLAIKDAKKNYEEHVMRAKEARQIAGGLKAAFASNHSFTPEERKRLERLEKLTRRIRNEAGGSDTEDDPKDIPLTIDLAVSSLAEMADELCKEVESTPRRVISTSIIARANKLITVIEYVRATIR